MQSMDSQINSGSLSNLKYLFFYLFPCLFNHFFNSGRMNPTVSYKLVQGQTCYFSSDWIKSRKNYCFRGIVDDNLYAGCSFKRPYISAFTTDYAAFHLILSLIHISEPTRPY